MLGDRGTCEVEVGFRRDQPAGAIGPELYVSRALLSDPHGNALATMEVTIGPCAAKESQLELHPAEQIGPWWDAHLSAYLDLAHAALEELAQELLWYHSRLVADSAA